MALTRSSGRTTRTTHTTTTTTTKPSLLSRLTGAKSKSRTTTSRPVKPTTARRGHKAVRATPAHHQRRRPSLGDKVSGAVMKLKGSLTGRSGQKAAGTRRMHGTDGKGSHRVY